MRNCEPALRAQLVGWAKRSVPTACASAKTVGTVRRAPLPTLRSSHRFTVGREGVMRKAILAALVALLISGSPAHAQKFPSRPITIVVPFSAGGPSDAMLLLLADQRARTLGKPPLFKTPR